jgi:hypothetical protein
MSKQYNKAIKKNRRQRYIKRKKATTRAKTPAKTQTAAA